MIDLIDPAELDAIFVGLASAAVVVAGAVAAAAPEEAPLSVSDWADAHRMVSPESGSPFPGPWDNGRLPYLIVPMDRMGPEDPSQTVTVRGSAQTGKSECGVNAILSRIDQAPCSMLILAPSSDEAKKYNKVKFDASVAASPRVQRKVARQTGRSADGSTGAFKRFAGGFAIIDSAGTSKPLQMITAPLVVTEEATEYEEDVDGRGHPIDQARKRGTMAGARFKLIIPSTPGKKVEEGEKGGCRVTAEFEAGDQAQFVVPCPHCGDYSALHFENMAGPTEKNPKQTVGFYCQARSKDQPNQGCGALAENYHRHEMIKNGRWVPYFKSDRDDNPVPPDVIPAADIEKYAFAKHGSRWIAGRDCEGRAASFHIWQAMNTIIGWDVIWDEWRKVVDGRLDATVFFQQTLGLPYEGLVDRPEVEELVAAAGRVWAKPNEVPPFCAFLTMAVDVQVNRLEWAVYGWGRGGLGFRVATGILPGDPTKLDVWRDLDAQRKQTYAGPNFKPAMPVRCFVDSGNWTQEVYHYCRGRGAEGVFAIFGAKGPKAYQAPAVTQGTRRKVKFGGRTVAKIVPLQIGTHTLKSRFYNGLADGIISEADKPLPSRAILFPEGLTEAEAKQLTAEKISFDDPKKPHGEWVKVSGQANEQLDLGVYCLAGAWSLQMDNWDEDRWREAYEAALPDEDPALKDAGGLEQIWGRVTPPPAEQTEPTRGLSEADKAKLREMGKQNWRTS
ncbi:MAG: phage terminase large subunit family protein [Henriciella sp.]|nr:phage terminase large subunit family protein [Henriciella sp.]